jgi:hypothetical protein
MTLTLSQEKRWLLQAALAKGSESLSAWEKWKSKIDIADIDTDSYRILPQLYRNLSNLGVEESQLARLKGIYRYTWCKNRITFQKLETIARTLIAKGIRCLLLGDTAMIPFYYKNYGVQPLERLELLVPFSQATTAMDYLHELRWTSWVDDPKITIASQDATVFVDSDGELCELRWHVLSECCQAEANDDFWNQAVATRFNELTVYVLAPTDHLLRQLTEKPKMKTDLSLQWMVNTMNLACSSESPIDWSRLMEQGQKRCLLFPIKDRITRLATLPSSTIPSSVLASLATIKSSMFERLAYEATYLPATKRNGLLVRLSLHWCQYRRLKEKRNLLQNLLGFAQYLQRNWRIDHLWKVPAYAFFRSRRRMWKEGVV